MSFSGIVLVDYGDMPKTLVGEGFSLAIEYDREGDGRWPLRLITDRLIHWDASPVP